MTLSALGIFSAAGAGGGVSLSDYELIETAIVSGTSTSSITFSNLGDYSSVYKHLQIRAVARTLNSSDINGDYLTMRFNGVSSSIYDIHYLSGNGSSVSSNGFINEPFMYIQRVPNALNTANSFAGIVIDFLDPYSTTKNKTTRALVGNHLTSIYPISLQSYLSRSTSAIGSITIAGGSGNLTAGTRMSIYGVK
jgi:hypothetical protein